MVARHIDTGYVETPYGCSIYLLDVVRLAVIGPSINFKGVSSPPGGRGRQDT